MADARVEVIEERTVVTVFGADLLAPMLAAAEGFADAAENSAASAAASAASITGRYANLAAALAGTTNGISAIVGQAGGYADELYLNVSGAMALQMWTPAGAGVLTTYRIANEGLASVIQAPVESLVSIDPVYARFTDGRYGPASLNAPVTHNALSTTAQSSVPGGGTFTANYTADAEGHAVHRFQASAHGHILLISGVLTAQRAKAKFYIKSNAGAGSQSVTAGLYSHDMTIYALTEGTWTTVSVDAVATSGDAVAVWNTADALPVDVLIKDGMQLYFDGEAIPGTEPNTNHSLRPATGMVLPGRMTFGDGNALAPFVGKIDLIDGGVAPTLTEASYVVAFREDGTSGTNAAVLFTPTATGIDYYAFQTGVEDGALVGRILGTVYTGKPVTGQGWLVMSARFDGTSSSVHLDGVSMVEGSGHAAVAVPYLRFGGGGGTPAEPLVGFVGPFRFTKTKLSDADMGQMVNHVRDRVRLHGGIVPVRNWLFVEGDSNTAVDRDATPSWAKQTAAGTGIDPRRRIFAVSGSTADSVITRLPNTLKRIQEAKAFGANPIFAMMIGTNDTLSGLGTLQPKLQSIWTQARAAGAKVVAMTIPMRGDGAWSGSDWTAYNAMIRNQTDYFDALIDVAADAIFQDPADPIYFNQGDTLHFGGLAHTALAALAAPVISRLKV